MEITSDKFDEIVLKKIKDAAESGRAKRIFDSYGLPLGWDVTNVLLHAIDLKKLPEVLKILERHFTEHLMYQHPEIRGRVLGMEGNRTKAMFRSICADTLKLAMNTAESK